MKFSPIAPTILATVAAARSSDNIFSEQPNLRASENHHEKSGSKSSKSSKKSSKSSKSKSSKSGGGEDDGEDDGLVKVPKEMIDHIKEVVAIPFTTPEGKTPLDIPPDQFVSLNGHCQHWEDYKLAPNTAAGQCDQTKYSPNYPYSGKDGSWNAGIPYVPTKDTRQRLADITGASLSDIDSIRINSGIANATDGDWCGMPASYKHKEDNMTVPERLSNEYWKKCVLPRGGFINLLQCEACDEDGNNCTTTVLGYASLEKNVCYPAHHHVAQEAYWEIGGRGWWRTWSNVSFIEEKSYLLADNFAGAAVDLHAHRKEDPHEFDTTGDFNGDGVADSLVESMLMVYFWGIADDDDNNYRWAMDVRNSTLTYQGHVSGHTCGSTRRIPHWDGEAAYEDLVDEINC